MSRKFGCLLACFKKKSIFLASNALSAFCFRQMKNEIHFSGIRNVGTFHILYICCFKRKWWKTNKINHEVGILLWNWKYSRITNKTRLGFNFMNSESFAVKKYFSHRQLWFLIQLPSYNNTSSQPTIWPQIHAQPNWESNWVENIFHFIFLGKCYISLCWRRCYWFIIRDR